MSKLFLKFENFNGIPSFSGEIGDSLLSGKNATGKSSALSCILWILTGYTIDLKDNPKVQENGKFLDLVTTAELEYNGLKLGRTYSENWVKDRQTLELVFKGNETKRMVDGEFVKEAEFEKAIESFKIGKLNFKESLFSFMVPSYFTDKLDEDKRMAVVYDNIASVSTAEVAQKIGMPEFVVWYDSLKDPDKERSAMITACNDLKKERDSVESACNEKKKDSLVILPDLDELKAEKTAIDKAIEQLDLVINNDTVKTARLRIETEKRDFVSKFNKKKSDFENSESKKKREKEDKENEKRNEILKKNEEIEARNKVKKTAFEKEEKECKETLEKITKKEAEIQALRDEYTKESKNKFSGTLCPILKDHCQTLADSPDIQKLEADFNLARSNKLSDINDRGVKLKAELESLKEKSAAPSMPVFEKLLAVPEKKTFEVKAFEDVLDTSEFDNKLADLKDKKDDKTTEINKKNELTIKSIDFQESIFRHKKRDEDKARVQELEKKFDDLQKQYSEKQKKIAFIHDFGIKKAEMLEGDAGRVFGYKIKLYDFQVNGVPKKVCRFLDEKGVEFGYINDGAEINNGIIVCDKLQSLYNVDAPILVDRTESVNNIAKVQRTMIITKVTTDDFKIEKMEV